MTNVVEEGPIVITEEVPVGVIVEEVPVGVIESLVLPGPPGPQGPRGVPGGYFFEHLQTTPAAVWTINHNFGHWPAVTVLSTGGVEVVAEVIHTSTNQVMVYFDQPMSGLAICS